MTNSHFRFILSIMTPANNARASPGAVADAMIFPRAYSEPVFSSTIQLIAMRLKPNPIRDAIFPKKNNRNVEFFNKRNIDFYIIREINLNVIKINPNISVIIIAHFNSIIMKYFIAISICFWIFKFFY